MKQGRRQQEKNKPFCVVFQKVSTKVFVSKKFSKKTWGKLQQQKNIVGIIDEYLMRTLLNSTLGFSVLFFFHFVCEKKDLKDLEKVFICYLFLKNMFSKVEKLI